MERVEQLEWLDRGYGSQAEVQASLAEVGRINRYLGGLGALTKHLHPRLKALAKVQEQVSVLDLGTGTAEIPLALLHWAQQQHIRLQVIAVDLAQRHLQVAKTYLSDMPNALLCCADANRLPLPANSVDVVISTLFLHHFTSESATSLLALIKQVARHSIVMSDLERGRWPLLAFKLVQPIFARNAITCHDGALSIRRAYTPEELLALAQRADLPNARVYRHWPWRQTLISDCTEAFSL